MSGPSCRLVIEGCRMSEIYRSGSFVHMAGEAKVLTQKEISDVFRVLRNSRDQALFALGIYTGLRIAEIISLRYDQVFTTHGGARQNSIYQALREIGRIDRTIHILRCINSEELRQQETKELNKGEASHKLDRFLAFGKDGAFTGREFYDQLHTFSCLAILHNAVIAWNLEQIPRVMAQLRSEGHQIDDAILSHITPLVWKHINPFGRYDFNIERMTRI